MRQRNDSGKEMKMSGQEERAVGALLEDGGCS
jgi:hypothetical protein